MPLSHTLYMGERKNKFQQKTLLFSHSFAFKLIYFCTKSFVSFSCFSGTYFCNDHELISLSVCFLSVSHSPVQDRVWWDGWRTNVHVMNLYRLRLFDDEYDDEKETNVVFPDLFLLLRLPTQSSFSSILIPFLPSSTSSYLWEEEKGQNSWAEKKNYPCTSKTNKSKYRKLFI